MEVSPRDIVYTQPAEPLEGEEPTILHKLDLRYGYELVLLISFSCICITKNINIEMVDVPWEKNSTFSCVCYITIFFKE